MKKIKKAYEISDAKIAFVSLVDKAANKKQFLITKAEEGSANFTSTGKIIKVDEQHHYVTGIVYEPMVEDAHGNYMTEDEIIKAAYWFAKNGDEVDLQHSFEALEDAKVVENWVTKSTTTIGDTELATGTWLITVEITDDTVWEQVQKGELTGFSMGGVGKYSQDDVTLDTVEKGEGSPMDNATENKSILKKLAAVFGLDVVEKGAMTDEFNRRTKANQFWSAFSTLEDILRTWNWREDAYVFETDEEKIREALEEFSTIITGVLSQESITKSLGSCDQEIAKSVVEKKFNEEEEEEESEVKKEDIQKIIDEAIEKAIQKAQEPEPTPEPTPTVEEVKAEDIQKMIDEAITKAVAPILKGRGLPSNLNEEQEIEKNDEGHYLTGIL